MAPSPRGSCGHVRWIVLAVAVLGLLFTRQGGLYPKTLWVCSGAESAGDCFGHSAGSKSAIMPRLVSIIQPGDAVEELRRGARRLDFDEAMPAARRHYCPVPGCPRAVPVSSPGWLSLAAMRPHLHQHAFGRLQGDIPSEFLSSHGLTQCEARDSDAAKIALPRPIHAAAAAQVFGASHLGVGAKLGCEAIVDTVRAWLSRNPTCSEPRRARPQQRSRRSRQVSSVGRDPEMAPTLGTVGGLVLQKQQHAAVGWASGSRAPEAFSRLFPGELELRAFYYLDEWCDGRDSPDRVGILQPAQTPPGRIGLELIPSTCEVVPAARDHPLRSEAFPGFARHADGNFKLLGAAFGTDSLCTSRAIERGGQAADLLAQVQDVEHCQEGLLLMRACASFCKLAHSARRQWFRREPAQACGHLAASGEALHFACTPGLRGDFLERSAVAGGAAITAHGHSKRSFKDADNERSTAGFEFTPVTLESHGGGWSPLARGVLQDRNTCQIRCELATKLEGKPRAIRIWLGVALLQDYPWTSTKANDCQMFDYVSSNGLQKFLQKRKLRKGGPGQLADALSVGFVELLKGLTNFDPEQRFSLGETTGPSAQRRSVWTCRWLQGMTPDDGWNGKC
ncbi:unnamed protein product [Prorocentrum cordatum]|uniref:Protein kinase domain-containing protein n=1 Tax=Prorocentrum cordatum TaxID=2364126 RepID=A0ABN9XL46_9DINO|nr:unnamed protein product [Polarella glacialis]